MGLGWNSWDNDILPGIYLTDSNTLLGYPRVCLLFVVCMGLFYFTFSTRTKYRFWSFQVRIIVKSISPATEQVCPGKYYNNAHVSIQLWFEVEGGRVRRSFGDRGEKEKNICSYCANKKYIQWPNSTFGSNFMNFNKYSYKIQQIKKYVAFMVKPQPSPGPSLNTCMGIYRVFFQSIDQTCISFDSKMILFIAWYISLVLRFSMIGG